VQAIFFELAPFFLPRNYVRGESFLVMDYSLPVPRRVTLPHQFRVSEAPTRFHFFLFERMLLQLLDEGFRPAFSFCCDCGARFYVLAHVFQFCTPHPGSPLKICVSPSSTRFSAETGSQDFRHGRLFCDVSRPLRSAVAL